MDQPTAESPDVGRRRTPGLAGEAEGYQIVAGHGLLGPATLVPPPRQT